jgi:uncharacterized damage-inducible protein DinB
MVTIRRTRRERPVNPSEMTTAELILAYREGPAALREAIAGMDADSLRARPIPGKMSSLEVLSHIVDSDQFMCDRIKRTLATERPLLMGVESPDYAQRLSYQDRDVELDLQLLEVQRAQLAANLERISPDAWARTAVHSENGLLTVRDLFVHAVDHLEGHVATIRDKRIALGI